MKKVILVVMLIVMLVVAGTVVTFAQKACGLMGAMAEKKAGDEKSLMMGKHCPMMKPSIVATSDGGVVVLIGNKLIKYNRNLELKNETELKLDMAMPGQGTMKDCPMTRNCPMKSGEGSAMCPVPLVPEDAGQKEDK